MLRRTRAENKMSQEKELGTCGGWTKPDEVGWVLIKEDKGALWYIGVLDQILEWTSDPGKALRLSRREDADKLAELVDDCERIEEHMWCYPSKPSATEVTEPAPVQVSADSDANGFQPKEVRNWEPA